MFPLLLLGGAGLGLFLWLSMRDESNQRQITLVRGKRYAIAHRMSPSDWAQQTGDPTLGGWVGRYPGFCNFSNPSTSDNDPYGPTIVEVQFTAEWCAANMVWSVPQDIAIAEV